jgi:hypothetical protein
MLKPIELKTAIRNFINDNRQMYNTTICAEAALKHNAYFIVTDMMQKQKIKKLHPNLKCYTLSDFEHNIRGLDRSAVIFDAHVVYNLCAPEISEQSKVTVADIGSVSNQPLNNQINVKLSDDQLHSVKELNNEIFEGTASLSNVVRLLIVKGLKYYKEMI